MKNMSLFFRRTLFALLFCSLIFTGVSAVGVKAEGATDEAFVYYVSNGALYRVMSDGTKSQKLLSSFRGVGLKPAGDFLYFMYDEKSTTLLRIPMDGSATIPSRFQSDVVYYVADGGFIYYMDEKGAIYRASANASKATEAKLVADMADKNYPGFIVSDGRIYYNALKSGRTTWVASKPADGSGQVQWIAAGAIPNPWFTRTDNSSLYLMINTKPQETQYSTNCMVLYSLPRKGGSPKAINPKSPLDANAVDSGWWANGYYMYNKDIRLAGDGKFDYSKGKGHLLSMDGKTIQLHKTGVLEMANVGTDKLAFVDEAGKGFVSTIQNGKVTNTKALSISNAGYVRNLMTNGKVRATMLFAESGAYMLKPDLSLEKLVGVEWDLCMYKDDVSGFFYVNAGDNGRLYRMNDDGKTNTKLSDEKVDRLVLISKP